MQTLPCELARDRDRRWVFVHKHPTNQDLFTVHGKRLFAISVTGIVAHILFHASITEKDKGKSPAAYWRGTLIVLEVLNSFSNSVFP